MSALDGLNLFAAAISTVLAVVALWLSVTFYKMSSAEAVRSQRSADEIAASVKRLEALFGTMYSDTFSIVRDTVSDMRARVWKRESDGSVVADITSGTEAVQSMHMLDSVIIRLNEMSGRVSDTERALHRLDMAVGAAGGDTRPDLPVTANADNIDQEQVGVHVADIIRHNPGPITMRRLFVTRVIARAGVDPDQVAKVLFRMRVRWAALASAAVRARVVTVGCVIGVHTVRA
jgi:hypothetical protein